MSSIRDSLTTCVALLAVCVALLAACKEERAPAPAPAVATPPAPPPEAPPPAPTAADAAPEESPTQPVNAEGFGQVVGGVVAINIEYRWGYAHVDGRWIVEPRAQAAADMSAGRGWLTLEGALELVDVNGKQLALLPGARLVEVHPDGGATIERAGKKERLGRDGALIVETPPAAVEAPPAAVEAPPAAAEAPPAAAEAPPPAAQAVDAGDVLAAFSHVSDFVGNLAWGIKDDAIHCLRRDRKKGIIAKRLKVDSVSEVHPGWLIVNREKHLYSPCGYVNARCRMIIAPDDLATCEPFDETGLAHVRRLTKYRCFAGGYREECVDMFANALIDTDGNLVTSEYNELEPLENGLWRAGALWRSPGGELWLRWGLINPAAIGDAQVLVPPQYESIADRGEGWFIVKEFDGRHQLIQPGGRVLSLPPLAK